MTFSADPLRGQIVLDRYRIVRLVAKGGMGVIYLARTEGAAGFAKPFIVKRIIPDKADEESVKMFVREARITSTLDHPNIVDIIDFREEMGAHLMVLEYVHGVQLGLWRKFLRKQKKLLPAEIAIHIVSEVLDALDYAHTLKDPEGRPFGIVHRDATPSNVLIDVEGRVKLTDFGIARMNMQSTEFKTETPTVKGKFPYLAPELLKGRSPSPQSDIYSCGVMLHELLTGRNEFRAKDIATTVERVLHHDLTPVHESRTSVPEGLSAVVAKATARDVSDRYTTANAFVRALVEFGPKAAEAGRAGLKELATRSFSSQEFLDFGAPDLVALNEAWRNPDITNPNFEEEESVELDISFTEPRIDAHTVSKKRTPAWLLALLAVLLVVIGGLVLRPTPPAQPQQVVVVHGNVQTPDQPPKRAQKTPPEEDEVPPPKPPVPPTPPPKKVKPPSLSESFARHRKKITACAKADPASVPRNAEVSVRFRIDRMGRVQSANLIPSELEATGFGECILRAAKQTRFARQKKAMSFRIPVSVK